MDPAAKDDFEANYADQGEEEGEDVPTVPPGAVAPPVSEPQLVEVRCKACGAPLQLSRGSTNTTCTYCGTPQMLYLPPNAATQANDALPPPRRAEDDEDDDDDEEDEQGYRGREGDGVGVWGYRRAQYGPGYMLARSVVILLVSLFLLGAGLSSPIPNCVTNPDGSMDCSGSSTNPLVYFGAFLLLVSVTACVYYFYKLPADGSDD